MIPKFRAWDKTLGIIDIVSIDFKNKTFVGEHWEYGETVNIPLSDVKIMQSTGLFDNNGVEIFEGDVLKFNDEFAEYDTEGYVDGSSEGFNYVEIIRTKDGFGFGKIKIPESSLEIQIEDDHLKFSDCIESDEFNMETTGNIYQNPDLLESV